MLSFFISKVLAAGEPIKPPTTWGILEGSGGVSIINIVCVGLNWLFTAAILFSIVMILWTAVQYIRFSGAPDKLKETHKSIMYIAIGIAVAILAATLPVLINTVVGGNTSTDIKAICR